MQAKILISIGDEDSYELAQALLDRSAKLDRRGETEFYQALLLIRQGPEPSEVLDLLEKAKRKGHPHAVALLYKIYHEPYLLNEADEDRAERYRDAYGELDVARSGYPSFDKSLALVNQLVAPPSVPYQAPWQESPRSTVWSSPASYGPTACCYRFRAPGSAISAAPRRHRPPHALPARWHRDRRRWCRSAPPPSTRPRSGARPWVRLRR